MGCGEGSVRKVWIASAHTYKKQKASQTQRCTPVTTALQREVRVHYQVTPMGSATDHVRNKHTHRQTDRQKPLQTIVKGRREVEENRRYLTMTSDLTYTHISPQHTHTHK